MPFGHDAQHIGRVGKCNADFARTRPPRAGQYITVAENPSRDPHFAPRHYTISCRPADAADRLRITVKRLRAPAAGTEDGIMSSFINDLKTGDVVCPPPFPTQPTTPGTPSSHHPIKPIGGLRNGP